MTTRLRSLAFLLVALVLLGCNDDAESTPIVPTETETASPTSTATLAPEPTGTATAPATASPSATPTPDGGDGLPIVDLTGEPALDAVIEIVRAGDVAGLAALMRLHEVKCTTVQGMGGPPKCWQDGSAPGEVPDGTVVASFPMAVCELEWQPDATVVANTMLEGPGEWYSAIRLDGPLFGGETFFDEPYLPNPDHGLIFETPTGPVLFLLEGDAIVYASRFCGGDDPADFIDHPAYDATVTHRGPAWEN